MPQDRPRQPITPVVDSKPALDKTVGGLFDAAWRIGAGLQAERDGTILGAVTGNKEGAKAFFRNLYGVPDLFPDNPVPAAPPIPSANPVPFTGGQCYASYSVSASVNYGYKSPIHGTSNETGTFYGGATGRLVGVRIDKQSNGFQVYLDYQPTPTSATQSVSLGGSSGPNPLAYAYITNSYVNRTDGLPDDCGDPTGQGFYPIGGMGYGYGYSGSGENYPFPELPTEPVDPQVPSPAIPEPTGRTFPIKPQAPLKDPKAQPNTLVEPPGGGSGSGICKYEATDLTEVIDLLNQIIELIEGLEEENTQNPIPVTINLDYVIEDSNGNRQLKSQSLSVVQPPSNAVQLFNQSAEIALTNARLVRKIAAILGHTQWTFNNLTDSVEYDESIENLIRTYADESYTVTVDSEGSTSQFQAKSRKHKNIFELLLSGNSTLYMRQGLWKYPTDIKESIVDRIDDAKGKIKNRDIKLNDAQDYQRWFLQQLDEIFGKWQAKLEIEDTDLVKSGNQKTEIVIHSLSDAVTEILSQNVTSNIYLKALINMQSKNLVETVTVKKESIFNQYLLKTVLDYLGIQYKETALKLFNLITIPDPKKQNKDFGIDKFLESSEPEIVIYKYSGKETLQTTLTTLLMAASIIRGALTQKLPKNLDGFKKLIKGQLGLGDKTEEQLEEEWEQFKEAVEDGYPGKFDKDNKPYGLEKSQRPKLIKKDIPKDEKK